MIRALRPTDVGSFLAFRARVPTNEALIGPTLRGRPLSFPQFVRRSLALDPGHETWVYIEHGQIFGLVSARARFGADVWDVDHLMIQPSVDADRVCSRLLGHLCEAAVEEGVMKVFLRLHEHSAWLHAAKQSGFFRYTTEQVFVRPTLDVVGRPDLPGLRPRRPADHQALFQLYTAAVPAHVRQVEAMTLQEWRWIDTWGLPSMPSLRSGLTRRRRDLVLQEDGQMDAWLQIYARGRSLRLLVDQREAVDVPSLIRRGIAELGPGGPVVFSLRDYQSELAGDLEELGFQGGDSQALLARMLSVRVPERRLVPARAVQSTL